MKKKNENLVPSRALEDLFGKNMGPPHHMQVFFLVFLLIHELKAASSHESSKRPKDEASPEASQDDGRFSLDL